MHVKSANLGYFTRKRCKKTKETTYPTSECDPSFSAHHLLRPFPFCRLTCKFPSWTLLLLRLPLRVVLLSPLPLSSLIGKVTWWRGESCCGGCNEPLHPRRKARSLGRARHRYIAREEEGQPSPGTRWRVGCPTYAGLGMKLRLDGWGGLGEKRRVRERLRGEKTGTGCNRIGSKVGMKSTEHVKEEA